MGRFDGEVALVTGAASGMGRATAERLASEGAAVLGLDVNEAGLAETVERVSSAGGKIEGLLCDVSQKAECEAAVARAVEAFGRLDVLCNVAGIAPLGHMKDITEEAWNRVIGVNLSGVFFLSQAALPHLLESEGNIVNVASNAGLMGQAYSTSYCASKGGVVNLTRSMAMEFVRQKIRVNCVCPAGTNTGIVQNASMPEDVNFKLIQRYMGFRGLSEPEEIAAAIAYIASDDAKSVHGSIFSIDNGVTAG